MVESGVLYPSVFVVDSHCNGPPVPPRLNRPQRSAGWAQTLLFLLVGLALCGMAIEACFIYYLYHSQSAESATASKMSGDKHGLPAQRRNPVILPSKPVAHLTDGQNITHGKEVMSWYADGNTLLFEMEYKQGTLVIQREGYYYVYSKVFFKDSGVFLHSVQVSTPRYLGKSIPLLQSRKYTQKPGKLTQSNSFLGGVFHLNKDDAIFVKVNNIAQIVQFRAYENFFGAYMI